LIHEPSFFQSELVCSRPQQGGGGGAATGGGGGGQLLNTLPTHFNWDS
jgi:hypothetical protein